MRFGQKRGSTSAAREAGREEDGRRLGMADGVPDLGVAAARPCALHVGRGD